MQIEGPPGIDLSHRFPNPRVRMIVVISDTHGEVENMRSILNKLRELNPDLVVHLGDDYDDASFLSEFPLVRVPGVYESYYSRPDIPNRILLNLNGWLALVTHSHLRHENDLPWDPDPKELAERGAIDVILHGHTHIPRAEKEGGIIYINPGHMKSHDKKGYPTTFSLIEVGDELRVSISDLSGKVIIERSFPRKRPI